jgi:hypothetical protein
MATPPAGSPRTNRPYRYGKHRRTATPNRQPRLGQHRTSGGKTRHWSTTQSRLPRRHPVRPWHPARGRSSAPMGRPPASATSLRADTGSSGHRPSPPSRSPQSPSSQQPPPASPRPPRHHDAPHHLRPSVRQRTHPLGARPARAPRPRRRPGHGQRTRTACTAPVVGLSFTGAPVPPHRTVDPNTSTTGPS